MVPPDAAVARVNRALSAPILVLMSLLVDGSSLLWLPRRSSSDDGMRVPPVLTSAPLMGIL